MDALSDNAVRKLNTKGLSVGGLSAQSAAQLKNELGKLLQIGGAPSLNQKGLPSPRELASNAAGAFAGLNLPQNVAITDVQGVMQLFQQLSQRLREASQTQRNSDLASQMNNLLAAASKLEQGGKLRFAASIVQSVFQIGGSVLQAGMSVVAAASSAKSARLGNEATTMSAMSKVESNMATKTAMRLDAAELLASSKKAAAEGKAIQAGGDAAGGVVGGLGGIATSAIGHAADKKELEAKQLETKAKGNEINAERARELAQHMADIFRDIKDTLSSMERSRNETSRGIARNV
jgi:hypothetical protein